MHFFFLSCLRKYLCCRNELFKCCFLYFILLTNNTYKCKSTSNRFIYNCIPMYKTIFLTISFTKSNYFAQYTFIQVVYILGKTIKLKNCLNNPMPCCKL